MGPAVAILLIGSGLLITFGYARAVMDRANRDYKTTKAALPDMRKAYWRAWLAMIRLALWLAIGAAIVVILIVSKSKGHS